MKLTSFFVSASCLWLSNANAQVNLHTGESVYSIPIFEHTDPKSGLSSAVSLEYKSMGGVKVGEYASMVGQGWNLNAGGVITRIQHGEPDDQYQTENFTLSNNEQIYEATNPYAFNHYYPNGFMYSTFPLAEIPKEKALVPRFREGTDNSNKYLNSPRALDDKEQDVFYFNCGGIAGAFVIGKNGQVEVLNNSNLKVKPDFFTLSEMTSGAFCTKIKSFTIVDCNGIEYFFNDLEWANSVDIKETSNNPGTSPLWTVSLSVSSTVAPLINRKTITKWFLSKIRNPFTNDEIVFNYLEQSVNYLSAILPSYSLFSGIDTYKESISVLESRVNATTKLLSKIDFPDNFHVVFKFGYRADYPTSNSWDFPCLSGIQILYSDKLVHSAELQNAYFYKNLPPGQYSLYTIPYNQRLNMRLCLTGVTVDKLTHKFEYYTGKEGDSKDIVPPVLSLSQDAWGYYNGSEFFNENIQEYNTLNIFNSLNINQPFPIQKGLAANGLLKTITLPTLGKINFEYVQNTVNDNNEEKEVGGVRVSKITKKDPLGQNPDIVTEYSYLKEDGKTSGWGGEPYIPDYGGGFYYSHDDNFHWGGICGHGLVSQTPAFIGVYNDVFDIASKFGLVQSSNPLSLLVTMHDLSIYWVNSLDPNSTYYNSTHSYSPYFRGVPVSLSYSRVEEKITSNGINNGKAIHEFTAPENYNSEIIPATWPYSAKQRLDEWKYNLPLNEIVLNDQNKVVKKINFQYNNNSITLGDNFKSCKVESMDKYSSRFDWPQDNRDAIDESWFTQDFYYAKKGNSLPTKKVTEDYGSIPTNDAVKTEEFYDYFGLGNLESKNNLPREIYSYNSKGEKVGQTIYYTADYNISDGPMGIMKSKNILNLPITTLSWYEPKNSSDRFYTGIITTEYTITPAQTIKPIRIYTAFNDDPVPSSGVSPFDPSTIFIGYPNTSMILDNTYDVSGNLILSTGTGNKRVGYVYDHSGRYVTATVSNTDKNDFAYSSFETDDGGNWTISNAEYKNNPFSPTGKRYLNLNTDGTIVKEDLNTANGYAITYWSNSGPLTINGSQDPEVSSLITIREWTLYSHKIRNTSHIELKALNDKTGVDELRICAETARMSTVTFDPAYGKIAEADANNRVTYYTYDGVGRLQMIQDQFRNAIKIFDYNTIKR